jgi:hypothetical protein
MSKSEEIKKELQALLDKQKDLIQLAQKNDDILKFGTVYQRWYSRAYKLVEKRSGSGLHSSRIVVNYSGLKTPTFGTVIMRYQQDSAA